MAKRTIIVDDIDGSQSEFETRTFNLGGDKWEIDLSPRNPVALHTALRPFIAKGRRTATARAGPPRKRAPESDAIRAWAKGNGFEVNDRGRIPQDVLDAYQRRSG
jgi:Lsr2